MRSLPRFFPNQMLIVPCVITMDTAEPLISIDTGSGLMPGVLGMASRSDGADITISKILPEEESIWILI